MRDDDLATAQGIFTAVLLSLAMVLLLALCGGCSSRLDRIPPRLASYTPNNLDELDEWAEARLIAEAESVEAAAELTAGPEVVW